MMVMYWLALVAYLSVGSVVFFFAGINWYRLEGRYEYSPQKTIAIMYAINAFILWFIFGVPFLAILILDALQLAGAFMGTYF